MKQTILGAGLFIVGLAGVIALSQARSGVSTAAPAAASGQYPVLINTCLISNDVRALAAFYQLVLRIPPKFDGEGYAEFNTGAGVLRFSTRGPRRNISRAPRNRRRTEA